MDGTMAAVELLERAIGFTRGALAGVAADRLDDPTPCSDWRLRDLLDHMADSLDAFTEASSGLLPVEPTPARGTRVEVLREKACALLGAWTSPAAQTVWMSDAATGGTTLDARVLLRAGALEIVLHGWDVAQATGAGTAVPGSLARDLLPTAYALITDEDRGVRFAAPRDPVPGDASASLLGFCGRSSLWSHQSQQMLG